MNLAVWVILRASPVCLLYLKHDRHADLVPSLKNCAAFRQAIDLTTPAKPKEVKLPR